MAVCCALQLRRRDGNISGESSGLDIHAYCIADDIWSLQTVQDSILSFLDIDRWIFNTLCGKCYTSSSLHRKSTEISVIENVRESVLL